MSNKCYFFEVTTAMPSYAPAKPLTAILLSSLLVAGGCTNQENTDTQGNVEKGNPLNLSLPTKVSVTNHSLSSPTELSPAPDLLPDLFEEQPSDTKISGQLIVDEQSKSYRDAIKGAQISIEIKTN